MSLIDGNKEMQMIKKLADTVAKKKDVQKRRENCDSYFLKRSEKEAKVLRSIELYNFQTPMEFQKVLMEMWEELDDKMMQEFVTVCSVALYKNSVGKEEDGSISSFVYEF